MSEMSIYDDRELLAINRQKWKETQNIPTINLISPQGENLS